MTGLSQAAIEPVDLPVTRLAFVLSLIAGSTDTIGYLSLNGLFTAHITGNLVVVAVHLVSDDPAILSYLLAVPVFMLTLLLARLFASRLERKEAVPLRPLLLLELMLLLAFLVCCVLQGETLHADAPFATVAGMLGVAAMAVQTALVKITFANARSTSAMTTNVTDFMLALGKVLAGGDQAEVASARRRMIRLSPVLTGFLLGCALGAAGQAVYRSWALGLPAGLALLAVGMSSANGGRVRW
jgi:uncharacterized membrane protein YoaK (UPF0700 family)